MQAGADPTGVPATLAKASLVERGEYLAVVEQSLTGFEADAVERLKALTSLDNIRRVMILRSLHC
jgi:hypothetical protein